MSYLNDLIIEQEKADALFEMGEGEWRELYEEDSI